MRLDRLLCVAAVTLALAGALSGAAVAASQTVTIQSFTFMPATTTINAGETVTWQNHDPATHTATSDTGAFNTGEIGPNGTKTVAFAVAGTYAYRCAIHPTMKGTVVVLGPASAPSTPAPTPRPTLPPTPAPTAAPTAPPTAQPTAQPTASPSPSPSPTASPSASPSPTPSSAGTPIAVPSSIAAASPTAAGSAGPALGAGPGALIAIGGLALAAALGGIALYLYRRR